MYEGNDSNVLIGKWKTDERDYISQMKTGIIAQLPENPLYKLSGVKILLMGIFVSMLSGPS